MQSEQLKAGVAHPDPDLLTAFAEQSLTSREQEQVLLHLAQCVECREVVALAGAAIPQPEFAVPAVGTAAKRRSSIWSLGPLRWTAAAATAVVVLSAVWLNRPQHQSSVEQQIHVQTTQENTPSADTAVDRLATPNQAPAASSTITRIPDARSPVLKDKEQQKRPERVEPASPRLSAPSGHIEVNAPAATVATENKQETLDAVQGQTNQQLATNGRSFAQLSQLQTGLAKTQSGAVAKAPVGEPAQAERRVAKEDATDEKDKKSVAREDVALAANAPRPSAQSAMTYSRKPAEDLAPANQVTQSATISPGTSRDGTSQVNVSGQNEKVTVAAESVQVETADLGAAPRAKAVMSPPVLWRVTKSGELEQSKDSGSNWQTAFGEHPSKFRTVAFSGTAVWAGGDDGTLWSSQDNGETWRKLMPSADGRSPRGAVQRIQLTAPGGVTFRTNAGEVWTSLDGGTTWTVAAK